MIPVDDLESFGPAMRALTEKQRRYVLAMLANPFGNPTRWARDAGYSDVKEGAKVRAHFLAHNPAIERAVNEVARQWLTTRGPILGIAVMMRTAANPDHPKQLRAAEMLANRAGFHETTEHTVNVNHSDRTGVAMAERIRALAGVLGVDADRLLGLNAPVTEPVKLIEGEVTHEET